MVLASLVGLFENRLHNLPLALGFHDSRVSVHLEDH